ncbi:MAG: SGNH/GDSL hydrolase family protein [Fuerstiella sp.]
MRKAMQEHLKKAGTPREHIRVLALGDCNTRTIDPKQGTAADGLMEALQSRGFETSLVNISGGMASSREGLAQICHFDVAADLAIINYGLVDSWITTIPQFYVPYFPDSPARRRARKFLKFVKRRLRHNILRRLVPTGPVVPETEFEQNVRSMVSVLRRRNPATAVFLWATLPVDDNAPRNFQLARYNGLLNRVADTEQAVFIDTEKALADQPRQKRFIDGVHLSPDSASRLGAHILNVYLASRAQTATIRSKAA